MATFCVLHNVEAEEKAEEVAVTEQRNASQAITLDEPRAQVHLGRVGALHHNTEISDGRSDAKSGYSDRQPIAKNL